MKSYYWIIAALIVSGTSIFAQEPEKKETPGFVFTDQISIPNTSVKNQYKSGTCWSFSGIAFVEAELLRTTRQEYDLSEMFCVYHTYSDRAEKFVRLNGHLNFSSGAEVADVFRIISEYGLVPDTAFPGLNYGEENHVHGELDEVLKAYVNAVILNKNKKLTPVWHDGFDKILDTYLGELPEKFTYEGKEYTPQSFRDMTGFKVDDYLEFTSYTDHPFYTEYALEISDNWLWEKSWNVPMVEMMAIIDNALQNGFSINWGADVSDKGFSWKNGVAILPDGDKSDLSGSEKERWEALIPAEKQNSIYSFEGPVKEVIVTQEMRQQHYDNYMVTDDHGMLIVGTAVDQAGNKYYKIKNSWGVDGHIYDGYFYASEAYVQLQTIGIAVHKDAVPKNILKKLGE